MALVIKPYGFPTGYNNAKYPPPFRPWNGAFYPSPARQVQGASQELVIASVPADLSTLIITAPNGAQYIFQFVYNASVQNAPGSIKVPLPASGASTAAQVTTALTAVLQSVMPLNLAGQPVLLPWVAISGLPTHVTLNYTVPGLVSAIGGTQVTITQFATAPQTFVLANTVPGKCGFNGAFLHG